MKVITDALMTDTEHHIVEWNLDTSGRAIVRHVLNRNGVTDLMSLSWERNPMPQVTTTQPVTARRPEPWWKPYWRVACAVAIAVGIVGVRVILTYGIG